MELATTDLESLYRSLAPVHGRRLNQHFFEKAVQDSGQQLPTPSDTGAEDAAVEDETVHYWAWGPFGEPPVQPTSVDEVCTGEAAPASPEPTSQPRTDADRGSSTTAATDVEGAQIPLPATR